MDNLSIFFCTNCDSHFGLFYKWDEIDSEKTAECCCVCGSDRIKFVEDKEGLELNRK